MVWRSVTRFLRIAGAVSGSWIGTVLLSGPVLGQAITGAYVQAVVGANSSLALRDDGQLWAWGMNSAGQLGDGSRITRARPVLLPTPPGAGANTKWTQVAMGGNSTGALRSDGTLWMWGNNDQGQLGTGAVPTTQSSNDEPSPVLLSTPTGAAAGTYWTSVATSGDHTLALRSDGTLWSWGYNYWGQLGLNNSAQLLVTPQLVPTPTDAAAGTTWTSCAASGAASYALRSDGTLWSWGKGQYRYSTLGHPAPANGAFSPALVPAPATAAAGTQWSAIMVGGSDTHVLAFRSDGTLWGWGMDTEGQLGLGTAAPAAGGTNTPLQIPLPATAPAGTRWVRAAVGEQASLGLLSDGSLWGWGRNYTGLLGINVQPPSKALPTQEYNRETWTTMAAGLMHSVAISRGRVFVAGSGGNGQLGLGNNQSSLSLFVQIVALPLASAAGQLPTDLSLYPNPARAGEILTLPGSPAHSSFLLRTVQGQTVAAGQLTAASQLLLPKLPAGMYLLSLEVEGHLLATRKLSLE